MWSAAVVFLIVATGSVFAESLTLDILAASISEAAGTNATTATVTASAPVTNNVLVTLANSHPMEISLPASVTIFQNESEATFSIDSTNDGNLDGTQTVTITASAIGYISGADTVDVLDDDTLIERTLGGKLSGTVSSETYRVVFDVDVRSNQVLTIESGTILRFDTNVSFNVAGRLNAAALEGAQIRFTSSDPAPAPGQWRGILISSYGRVPTVLKHVEVCHALTGVSIAPDGDFPEVQLTECRIFSNSVDGIAVLTGPVEHIATGDIRIENNQIYHNSRYGVYLTASTGSCGPSENRTLVGNNSVFGCGSDGIYVDANATGGSGCPYSYLPRAATMVQLVSNLVSNNIGNGIRIRALSSGCGIATDSSVIEQNTIVNNTGSGIRLDATVSTISSCLLPGKQTGRIATLVDGNMIAGNGQPGIAAQSWRSSSQQNYSVLAGYWVNNIILSNLNHGLSLIANSAEADLKTAVLNNSILRNQFSGLYHDADTDSGFRIQNNLVVFNQFGVRADAAYTPQEGAVGYNDVYGNSGRNWSNYPVAFGQLTSTNINGTPADLAFNLGADPGFVSPADFHLSLYSPCLNAGTNTENLAAADIDGETRISLGRVDIGADEVQFMTDGDTDGDSLPNGWEVMMGLNPLLANGGNGADGDPDGDGESNWREWQAGTRPLDPGSLLTITAITRESDNIRVTWKTAGGRTNILQVAAGESGAFATNFVSIGNSIIVAGSGDVTTNRVETGGAINGPARFYRVKVVP
jgi:hypothetical protein